MKTIFKLIITLFLFVSMVYALAVDAGTPDSQQMLVSTDGSSSMVLVWKTASYLVRVDETDTSGFILALWEKGKDQQQLPDLIITGGKFVPDGSGGNHYFQFMRDELTYRCFVISLGTAASPPGYLIILNDEKEILREPVFEEIYSAR